MRRTSAPSRLPLPLFALLALVAGWRAGLAAPVTAPLPLPAGGPPPATDARDAAGLAHAAFAVG
ncbi:MAG TPA: hypothetical protein VN811_00025 [Thermoanaerobaculia bacterium]|nr:hypothetical protein [Thermoanaerobaculia bacterium]